MSLALRFLAWLFVTLAQHMIVLVNAITLLQEEKGLPKICLIISSLFDYIMNNIRGSFLCFVMIFNYFDSVQVFLFQHMKVLHWSDGKCAYLKCENHVTMTGVQVYFHGWSVHLPLPCLLVCCILKSWPEKLILRLLKMVINLHNELNFMLFSFSWWFCFNVCCITWS